MFPQASLDDLEKTMAGNISIDFAIEEMLSRYSDDADMASMYAYYFIVSFPCYICNRLQNLQAF